MIVDRLRKLQQIIGCPKNVGHCPICDGPTLFVEFASWLRDNYLCLRCCSIPRQRAIVKVIQEQFPAYRTMAIHESSPSGPASAKIQRNCPGYVASQFYPDVAYGTIKDGCRCENLEKMTYADETFDLVITQDVLEHVFHPEAAFAEIARTLKPGGAHVFTVPLYVGRATLVRAFEEDGAVRHLQPPDYHGNPISAEGSLVVREWGDDLPEVIRTACGLETEIFLVRDRRLGIDGKFLEVFVSRKVK